MKLLTTMALLCFSVTANADIFVCQAKEIVTSSQFGKGFFIVLVKLLRPLRRQLTQTKVSALGLMGTILVHV
jgi:hypothetical protein